MKKLLILVIACSIFLTGGLASSAGAQEQPGVIQVFLDGLPVVFDTQPVIENDRTLVPFRAVAEALNVAVTWNGSTQTITATDGEIAIWLGIGSKTAYLNDTPVILDAPPVIHGYRTLIPLRFFTEAFNCQVQWDGVKRYVHITSPPKAMTVVGFYALGDQETSSWTNLFGKAYPALGSGNIDVVSALALGWYTLDEQGNLLTGSNSGWRRPEGWEDILDAADRYNLETGMVVHLTDGAGLLSNLLTNEAAMSRAIGAITKEANLYKGVNLDFEGLGWSEEGEQLTAVRNRLNRFVRLLSLELRKNDRSLTLTLHAPNSAYQGYDYQTLGGLADRIIIMAYDYGARPEPLNLVVEAVEMAGVVVPPKKLVLGISIPSETAESLMTKVGVAKRYGLEGIAIWRLGLVSDEMWSGLRSKVFKNYAN
ncbi:MAG: stalk domain-containing protein [Desulfotomaculaceae bacterium]|nr:stalk domain-containing protein [Desulfotomaculaceae bacterium]